MDWIDSHVHLEDDAFAVDREAVLERARAVGVREMILAGSTQAANQAALALANRHEGLFVAIGLHPHEFPRAGLEAIDRLPDGLSQERVVALGEIGLDYHLFPDYPEPDREVQQEAFRRQLRWARLFELPVILHVREAYPDALRILREEGPLTHGGVMHCYAGGPEYLTEVLELGFHIGVGATVTYPKAEAVREAVRRVPEDRLILETDAPYLPPQVRRGERNEPAYLPVTAQAVAAVRQQSLAALAERTTHNARQLFKIAPGRPGVIAYAIAPHVYINLTNRCTAHCAFCPRHQSRQVSQYDLTLQREPSAIEVIEALGDIRPYQQVVFCGFGEPLLRLPTLLAVARWIKATGGQVRVNTNGQADIVLNRDILPECRGVVDEWSISLNTADPEQYRRLVRPATVQDAHAALLAFASRAVRQGFRVTLSAVDAPGVDMEAAAALAKKTGARFRGRTFQRLGEPENQSATQD